MKCAKLQLQDRFKPKVKPEGQMYPAVENPRRYCQKRMVNPQHEEDPRWTDVYERYHCNTENNQANSRKSARENPDTSDMFLTVQTLKFQGDVDRTKKARASFKYKVPTDGAKHRMFVKQAVDNEFSDEDRSSQLTCYYFDDYVKYLFNNDKSRPDSGKSSMFQGFSDKRENKATQVYSEQTGDNNKMAQKYNSKLKGLMKKRNKLEIKDDTRYLVADGADDSKISFSKSGKRSCLTISRAQSPETVHVIRVDVVCNNSNGLTHYESHKKKMDFDSQIDIQSMETKRSYFTNKYLLTNTIKKLDENLSGAKVTLMCKTFRLSERLKTHPANKVSTTDEKCIRHDLNKHNKEAFIRKQIHFSSK